MAVLHFFLKPRKAQVFFGSAYRFIHISIHTVQTNTKPTVNKKTLVQTVMCKRQSERDGFFLIVLDCTYLNIIYKNHSLVDLYCCDKEIKNVDINRVTDGDNQIPKWRKKMNRNHFAWLLVIAYACVDRKALCFSTIKVACSI